MNQLRTESKHLEAILAGWLTRHSVTLLRISMGLVFLGFGVLKFFPGLSPAEGLVQETVGELTFGLLPDDTGLVLVAAVESTVGLCLLTGRLLRVGLALLGMTMIGILSPMVLLPDELFRGSVFAPTLEGQYVFKDIVLLASTLVIASSTLGGRRPQPRHQTV